MARRTRDTHDPLAAIPQSLLDEISEADVKSSLSPQGIGGKSIRKRKNDRKQKRLRKKRAAVESRSQWLQRRKESNKISAKKETAAIKPEQDLLSVNVEPQGKAEVANSEALNVDNLANTHIVRKKRKRAGEKQSLKKPHIDVSHSSPDKLPSSNVDKLKDGSSDQDGKYFEHDNPDVLETRRLERLLGIQQLRNKKKTQGNAFAFSEVFGDYGDDLVDLLQFCEKSNSQRVTKSKDKIPESTLPRHSTTSGETSKDMCELGGLLPQQSDDEDNDAENLCRERNRMSEQTEIDKNASLFLPETDTGCLKWSTTQSVSPSKTMRGKVTEHCKTVDEPAASDISSANSLESKERLATEGDDAVDMVGKYVPRSARKRGNPFDTFARQIRGLLNRVADVNASGIAADIITMFNSNNSHLPRRELAGMYANAALDSVKNGSGVGYINPYVLSHAAIASHVGKHVDSMIMATLLVSAVRRINFCLEHQRGVEEGRIRMDGDECRDDIFGYIAVVGCLYERRAISSDILYDLVRLIAEHLSSTRLEMLLSLLRQIGPSLKVNDPISLKQIIEFIQDQTALMQGKTKNAEEMDYSYTKLQVIQDLINSIKNNKVKRSALSEHRGRFDWADAPDIPLSVSIKKLFDDEFTSLRWWEVTRDLSNASNTGDNQKHRNQEGAPHTTSRDNDGPDLSALASSLRLNTEYRKALFTSIMSSTSVSDSFGKLERMDAFNSRKHHDRDAALVILYCCGHEKDYNPFYGYLAERMCLNSRGCRFTFEFALWDMFKLIPGSKKTDPMPKRKVRNLSHTLAHLWCSGALSLSVLRKVGDFEDLTLHERTFFCDAVEILLSKLTKMDSGATELFTKLAKESWNGVEEFRLSFALFLRRMMQPKIGKNCKMILKNAIRIIEDGVRQENP